MTEWLTLEEVGNIIRCEDARTIKKFIRENGIRVCKPCGRLLVSKDDVSFAIEQKIVKLY